VQINLFFFFFTGLPILYLIYPLFLVKTSHVERTRMKKWSRVEKYNNIDWFFTNFRETRNKNIVHEYWLRVISVIVSYYQILIDSLFLRDLFILRYVPLGIARLATANTSAVKNRAPDIILNLSIIFGQNKSCRAHKNEEMIESGE
jgi:hypothetical protein